MIFLAVMMMMAQAPTMVPPAATPPVKMEKKPKQVCTTVDVTGSRVPQRICHNADDPAPMQQDIKDAFFGVSKENTLGKVHPPPQ